MIDFRAENGYFCPKDKEPNEHNRITHLSYYPLPDKSGGVLFAVPKVMGSDKGSEVVLIFFQLVALKNKMEDKIKADKILFGHEKHEDTVELARIEFQISNLKPQLPDFM